MDENHGLGKKGNQYYIEQTKTTINGLQQLLIFQAVAATHVPPRFMFPFEPNKR